jgi:Amidase
MIMRSAPRSCRMATSARRSCALFPRGFPFPREQIPWRPPGRQARRASSPIDLSDALWHDRRARALHGRSPARAFDGIVRRLSLPGKAGGPPAGASFAVKDLYDVAGYPTGAGNPDWERTHPVPTETAPAVRRLLDAGATLVGKSCTDELASTSTTARPSIRASPTACPEARPVDRSPPSPRDSSTSPSAPTRAAPSASPRATAACSAFAPPTAPCPSTAWCRSRPAAPRPGGEPGELNHPGT